MFFLHNLQLLQRRKLLLVRLAKHTAQHVRAKPGAMRGAAGRKLRLKNIKSSFINSEAVKVCSVI
jgi:hypothetical protein